LTLEELLDKAAEEFERLEDEYSSFEIILNDLSHLGSENCLDEDWQQTAERGVYVGNPLAEEIWRVVEWGMLRGLLKTAVQYELPNGKKIGLTLTYRPEEQELRMRTVFTSWTGQIRQDLQVIR